MADGCGFKFKMSHLITILKCHIWNKLLSKELNLERKDKDEKISNHRGRDEKV